MRAERILPPHDQQARAYIRHCHLKGSEVDREPPLVSFAFLDFAR